MNPNIPAWQGFLLTCLLRGMTTSANFSAGISVVSTHMPLARHDFLEVENGEKMEFLLTCLLRGMTNSYDGMNAYLSVSTHMPLARHDSTRKFR